MGILIRCGLAASLWFCSAAASAVDPVAMLATLKAVERETIQQPGRLRQARLRQRYESEVQPLLEPASLASFDDAQLAALLEGIGLTVFHTGAARHVRDMEWLIRWIESSRPLKKWEATTYFRALVRTRQFEAAAALARRIPLPDVEPVPYLRVDDPPGPAGAYRVAANGRILWPLRPALTGTRLLLVVHPLCAFSRRAEVALARIANELPMLDKRMLRLAPPGERLFLDVLAQWNADHLGREILLARHESDWPMIDDWATPNFYLLHDGRVIDHFSGWPPAGNEARLRQMYAAYRRCLAGACRGE